MSGIQSQNLPTTTVVQDCLSLEQFKAVLPDAMKKTVNQSVVDSINQKIVDPELREIYRENILSYADILKQGGNSLEKYIDAVKYVSHKVMGATNIEAFVKVFPDKYQDWLNQGVSNKDISSYISAYNKRDIVNKIYERSIIPTHILNQDLFQEAINSQAHMMRTAKSEKVRSDAANSLLTHLKPPEAAKIKLDVSVQEDSSIAALREATWALADAQRQAALSGTATAKDIAGSKLVVDVEAKEV